MNWKSLKDKHPTTYEDAIRELESLCRDAFGVVRATDITFKTALEWRLYHTRRTWIQTESAAGKKINDKSSDGGAPSQPPSFDPIRHI
jgi:hypothetical protein